GEGDGVRRKGGDAAGEAVDEGAELVRWERAVQVAPPLCGLGVDVDGAEDDLECPPASDEARDALGASSPRQDPERYLHLVHDGFAPRSEAHVARRREL